jgi:hypothetical protein
MACRSSSGNNATVNDHDTKREARSRQHQETGRPEPFVRGRLSTATTKPPDNTECSDDENHAHNDAPSTHDLEL